MMSSGKALNEPAHSRGLLDSGSELGNQLCQGRWLLYFGFSDSSVGFGSAWSTCVNA